MIVRSTLLCLAILSAAPASAIPTVNRAAPALRTQAEQGDAAAMARLGWHYYRGEGVAKDLAEAVKWFAAAAENKDPLGMLGLGLCLEDGKGIAKDEARALDLYRQAGATEALALYRQAAMLLDGLGAVRDLGAVQALVDTGLARGEAAAMLRLAAFLLSTNRIADAEPVVQRVMRHPASVGARGERAFIRAGQLANGQLDAAEASYRKLLALSEKHRGFGPNSMRGSALQGLGKVFVRLRRYEEAQDLLQQALKIQEDVPMRLRYPAALAMREIGELFMETGDFRQAEAYYLRALGVMLQIPSSAGWNAAAVLHAMGSNFARQGNHGLAASHFERALTMRFVVQRDHRLTRESGAALAAAYRSLGREGMARELEVLLDDAAKEAVRDAVKEAL